MNDTIRTMMGHRSVRKFRNDPVPERHLDLILSAAQMASTSSNMQAYSAIGITDPAVRQQFAELSGHQRHVAECGTFLVWCADLFKIEAACLRIGETAVPPTVEYFIVATVDTALAAQNAAVAAESLGYGIVFIGGIRNDPERASRLLSLPPKTYPVFGMCIGIPDHTPPTRPRLPKEAFYHENRYDSRQVERAIPDYNETMRQYMLRRTQGTRSATWSEDMEAKMKTPARLGMKNFLRQQGLDLI